MVGTSDKMRGTGFLYIVIVATVPLQTLSSICKRIHMGVYVCKM